MVGVMTVAGVVLAMGWALSDPYPQTASWVPTVLIALLVASLAAARILSRSVVIWTLVGAVAVGTVHALDAAPPPGCDVVRLLEGQPRSPVRVTLEARVFRIEPHEDGSLRLRVQVLAPQCGKLLLTIKHPGRGYLVGERLRVRSYLRRIEGFGNRGGFDWAGWNARRGVRVSAYLWKDTDTREIESLGRRDQLDVSLLQAARIRLRAAIRERGDTEGSALVEALLLGDRSRLGRELQQTFRDAGASHVLAISGMHMAVVVGAVLQAVRWLLLRLPVFSAYHDVMRPSVVAALTAMLGYAGVSGGGISVARAAIMASAALRWLWRGGRADAWPALGLAAIAVSLAMPGAVREASFQLSFAAVGALLLFAGVSLSARIDRCAPVFARACVFAADTAVAGAVAWSATAPLAAQHFGRVSFVGVATGVLALLPLAAALWFALAGALAAAFAMPGATLLMGAACFCAQAVIAVVHWCASWPWASAPTVAPGWPLIGLWLSAPVLVLTARGRMRLGAIAVWTSCLVLLVAAGLHGRYGSHSLDVLFVSVGQGEATIVRLPGGKTMLVDTGPPGRVRLAVDGELRRLWIRRIDYLVLTHVQSDHWGAAPELFAGYEIGEVWRPAGACSHAVFNQFVERAEGLGIPVHEIAAWDRQEPWAAKRWGLLPRTQPHAAHVEVLSPPGAELACDDNDASIVLRLAFAGHSVLLTGDAEGPAEQALLASGRLLRADVLKAGHHGSGTSSHPGFVDAVAPRYAVASLGAANRYGFPHARVRTLFESRSIRFYRTDLDGAVSVRLSADGVSVSGTRGGGSEPGFCWYCWFCPFCQF